MSSSSSCSSEELDPCPIDTVIDGNWKIVKKLGQGGFGCVYKVCDLEKSVHLALKVDCSSNSSRGENLLKLELNILRRLQGMRHVCNLIGAGSYEGNSYFVMSLLGPDLDDMRHMMPKNSFSLQTSILAAIQCLTAIKEVHSIGVVHRDIKPSNFAIGSTNETRHLIRILDFGMARYFVDYYGSVRKQRDHVGFRGTIHYASINALYCEELGRVDDLISLFYILVEFIKGSLPWRKLERRRENREVKKSVSTEELLRGCPEELHLFYARLCKLSSNQTPDYAALTHLLTSVLIRKSLLKFDGFDWDKFYRTPEKDPRHKNYISLNI